MQRTPLYVGQIIAQYKISERIGVGGMGEVYLAIDTVLNRRVALKFLPSEDQSNDSARARLLQEARALASLIHSNICTLFEIKNVDNQLFLAMEYIEGETLTDKLKSGRIDFDNAIDICIQISNGLEAAHEKGLVHRDIKPGNVMIQADGTVKILDFGLAQLSDSLSLTKSGTAVGTSFYMSPEQVRAEKVDYRTDLWATGVLLYEMLCGKKPFEGTYDAAIIYSILNEDPPRDLPGLVDADARLIILIAQLLEKSKNKRPSSAQEVKERLSEISAGMVPVKSSEGRSLYEPNDIKLNNTNLRTGKALRIRVVFGTAIILAIFLVFTKYVLFTSTKTVASPSILVLPFEDISIDQNQTFLADGIADELMHILSRTTGMRVAGRYTAAYYSDNKVPIRDIGRQQNVDYILQGSIRNDGERLLVTVDLSSTRDGFQVWGERYNRDYTALLDIQSDIARAIADELQLEFDLSANRNDYRPDPDAHFQYLLGLHYLNKQVPESVQQSIHLFELAIELDPQYAVAYAALARSYVLLFEFGYGSIGRLSQLVTAAEKSFELDPLLAEAQIAMAGAYEVTFRLNNVLPSLDRAIQLDKSLSTTHHWQGSYYLNTGDLKRAREKYLDANRLDPMDKQVLVGLMYVYTWLENASHAREVYNRLMEIDSSYTYARLVYPFLLAVEGSVDEALREADSRWSAIPYSVRTAFLLGLAYRTDHRKYIDQLEAAVDRERLSFSTLMLLEDHLGNVDKAFQYAFEALRTQDYPLILYHYLFTSDVFHRDERFRRLQTEMNILPSKSQ